MRPVPRVSSQSRFLSRGSPAQARSSKADAVVASEKKNVSGLLWFHDHGVPGGTFRISFNLDLNEPMRKFPYGAIKAQGSVATYDYADCTRVRNLF